MGLHKHMYTNVLKSNSTRAIMHLSDLLKHNNIFFSHSFEPRAILYAQQFTIYVKGHLMWRHFSEEIEIVMTGKKIIVQEDAFRLCGKKWYNQHVKFNWRLKQFAQGIICSYFMKFGKIQAKKGIVMQSL